MCHFALVLAIFLARLIAIERRSSLYILLSANHRETADLVAEHQ